MRNFIVMFFILLLFYGCTRKTYRAQTMDQVDFTSFDTFAFLPTADSNSLYNEEIIHFRSMTKVNNELNERGYELDTANPELLVAIHTMFEGISENPYNNYPQSFAGPGYIYYYRGYHNAPEVEELDYQEIEYTQGTLMIDVIHIASNRLIWRGWSNRPINPTMLPTELSQYIKMIFEKYPVKPL